MIVSCTTAFSSSLLLTIFSGDEKKQRKLDVAFTPILHGKTDHIGRGPFFLVEHDRDLDKSEVAGRLCFFKEIHLCSIDV